MHLKSELHLISPWTQDLGEQVLPEVALHDDAEPFALGAKILVLGAWVRMTLNIINNRGCWLGFLRTTPFLIISFIMAYHVTNRADTHEGCPTLVSYSL